MVNVRYFLFCMFVSFLGRVKYMVAKMVFGNFLYLLHLTRIVNKTQITTDNITDVVNLNRHFMGNLGYSYLIIKILRFIE